jgi:N-acetylglutamate synthase
MPARDLHWRIEETCFNAFPSLKQVLLRDFLLRFAAGVSRRANSANPLCAEPREIAAAIAAAERLYRLQQQPAIFRVPSIVGPELDARLDDRGYGREGETCVLYAPIEHVAAAGDAEVQLLASPTPEWLAAMARLQGHSVAHATTYRRIVEAIAIPARFALFGSASEPAALAYGALHDGLICYESVITDPARRRQGLARRMIAALAAWARDDGAEAACLQVEAGNAPAIALYRGFGLDTELYRYRYRRAPAAP